jgi:hypothetical protein
MESAHANDPAIVAHAGRATVPDMTIACASGATVRRASEEASAQANASTNTSSSA